jgi:molybdate transport system substrate-binding protein
MVQKVIRNMLLLAMTFVIVLLNLTFVTPAQAREKKVTVFAASSLTETYSELGARFERSHPGVKVLFSFQASSTLATQIKAGAPADIFVSAAPEDMKGIAVAPYYSINYLINKVVLAVPVNSKLRKISDLNNGVTWIQCAKEVPCGQAATRALTSDGITKPARSYEPKASSVLAKLLAAEVDAAIVYRTDVIANVKLIRAIEFSDQNAASTSYQIVQLSKKRWAKTFYNYLNSRVALRYLQSRGFELT